MTKLKFIHTGDLHLDTPFKGLQNLNAQLAKKLADATMRSFAGIVDICIENKVDFLLVTGDIFDSEVKSLAAQLRFVSELRRLSDHGIAAFLIAGNHDPLNSWMKELELPDRVYRFGSDGVSFFPFKKNGKTLAHIHGISFAEKTMMDNLALQFKLADAPAPINIAMLHGTIGQPGAHQSYAPFSLADIRSKGFDYWALGHIHKHHVLQAAHPAVVYPGNPQGRDFGETGQRGCYLIDLTAGSQPQLTFIPTQKIRFEELTVDISGTEDPGALQPCIQDAVENMEAFTPSESYLIRLTFSGRTTLHNYLHKPGQIEGLLELFNEGVLQQQQFTWIDTIRLKTQPEVDLEGLRKANDFTAAVINAFKELNDDPETTAELLEDIRKQFALNVRRGELEGLSDEEMAEITEKAQWMIVDQLIKSQP